MPTGIITKALSGFYYVTSDGRTWQCRARGIFRKKGITPLVGDHVRFEIINDEEGILDDIDPRKNQLIRPPIANIDQALLVFSLVEPEFSPLLLDKFLVHTEKVGVSSAICLSKSDISHRKMDMQSYIDCYEKMGYPVIVVSAIDGQGLDLVRSLLTDRITVFAGQSGVGKSSLLNALMPALLLQTGEISARLGRGKHTTRHVELISLPVGGQVADTPGFSQLDFQNIEAEELGSLFVDIAEFAPDCKFRGCLHMNEPRCAVRDALDSGNLAQFRYDHYVQFLREIQDRKRRY
jgi:ribosome biogenesis GTPase